MLCTSFYYGKNGLASTFHKEFDGEVPEKALALAATAVRDNAVVRLRELTLIFPVGMLPTRVERGLHERKTILHCAVLPHIQFNEETHRNGQH